MLNEDVNDEANEMILDQFLEQAQSICGVLS